MLVVLKRARATYPSLRRPRRWIGSTTPPPSATPSATQIRANDATGAIVRPPRVRASDAAPIVLVFAVGLGAAVSWATSSLREKGAQPADQPPQQQSRTWEDTPREIEACRKLGLMVPAEAQKTTIIRVPNFLSAVEVDVLIEEAVAAQRAHAAGSVDRSAGGGKTTSGVWRTTYLHTGGLFRERLAPLHARIRRKIEEVDKAHWGLLEGRDPAKLNFRTVEYHEYGVEGRLSAERHIDAGSLVTIDIMLAEPGVDYEGASGGSTSTSSHHGRRSRRCRRHRSRRRRRKSRGNTQ